MEIHIIDQNIEVKKISKEKIQIFPGERITETKYYIKNEFNKNILDTNYSEPYGYLIFRIKRDGGVNWTWFVISTCSLYAINFTGFPLFSLITEIDIQLEILDSDLNIIKTYASKGKDTEHGAFYWGYYAVGGANTQYNSCINQAVHINALSRAIDNLKEKIQKDIPEINKKLKNAGKTS